MERTISWKTQKIEMDLVFGYLIRVKSEKYLNIEGISWLKVECTSQIVRDQEIVDTIVFQKTHIEDESAVLKRGYITGLYWYHDVFIYSLLNESLPQLFPYISVLRHLQPFPGYF